MTTHQCDCQQQIDQLRNQVNELWQALILSQLHDIETKITTEIARTCSKIDAKNGTVDDQVNMQLDGVEGAIDRIGEIDDRR